MIEFRHRGFWDDVLWTICYVELIALYQAHTEVRRAEAKRYLLALDAERKEAKLKQRLKLYFARLGERGTSLRIR